MQANVLDLKLLLHFRSCKGRTVASSQLNSVKYESDSAIQNLAGDTTLYIGTSVGTCLSGAVLGACQELDVVLIAEGAEFSLTGHFSDDA